MIFSFINAQESGSKIGTTVSNSYNTYNYNTYENPMPTYNQIKIPHASTRYFAEDYAYSYNPSKKDYRTNYYDYDRYKKDRNLKSTSKGYSDRYYGVFGNEINEYKVYVKNREHKGGYFTVKFHLTDYYGKTSTETMTHYLKSHEERKFVYRNVYNNDKEYKYWDYKIISHTGI